MGPIRVDRLVVVVAFAVAVAACGGAEAEEPATTAAASAAPSTTAAPSSTTAAPTTTSAPSTTAAPTTTVAPVTTAAPTTTLQPIAELPLVESAVGGTASGDGWLVEPGVYTSERLPVPARFTVGEQVALLDFDTGPSFGMPGVVRSQLDAMFFIAPAGIMPADVVGIHPPHDPVVPVNTEELPGDLGAWFEAVPQITVLANDAGDGWQSWDVTVDPSAGATFQCDFGNCVAFLVVPPAGVFVLGDVDFFRIWEFESGGAGIYALMQSDPTTVDDTLAMAEMLVDGVRFDG